MHKGKYQDSPKWVKVMQWLGVVALLTIVAIVVWTVVPGDHRSTTALKWFQLVQTVGTFLLPPFIVAWLWSAEPLKWLHLEGIRTAALKEQGIKTKMPPTMHTCFVYVSAILLMLVAMPGINLLAEWNGKMVLPECLVGVEQWMKAQEEAAMALTERFLSGTSVGVLLVNIGLMALLPALSEELTFRGVIQGLIVDSRKSKVESHVAVWVTAVLFSAIHLQFYGFVPRMLLGAMFGYMLVWTGSLWVPIVMHFTNNVVTVIVSWVIYRMGIDPEMMESFGAGETAWLGWLSLALTATGVYLFWRRSRQIRSASSRMS